MKIKKVKLSIKNLEEMKSDFVNTWKKAQKGKSLPEAVEEICFDSAEEMHKFLSPKRLKLLHIIRDKQPKSIYELSRILKRDRKNVSEDVALLENIGLIQVAVTKDGKRTKRVPLVEYEKIQLEIAV